MIQPEPLISMNFLVSINYRSELEVDRWFVNKLCIEWILHLRMARTIIKLWNLAQGK